MNIRKILVATDFSPGAQSAIAVATRIANVWGAELVIAHAWEAPTALGGDLPPPVDLIATLRDEAIRGLDSALRDARVQASNKVSSTLLDGPPRYVLPRLLESPDFDLLVVGTHGRTGLSRVMLGSTAEKLVREAPCSVLVVWPDNVAARFTHVLCPIDHAPCSRDALTLAAGIAQVEQAKLTLVNVVDIPFAYSGRRAAQYIAVLDRTSQHLTRHAVEDVHAMANVPVEARNSMGAPGAQILAALDDDRSIDLVVMGTHGRTGLKRVFLGSVAEKVVRHARCPVLIARPREASV